MAFVVCEPCHDCKYTDCVVVCPCDCFFEDGAMLYIDPETCIDCDACKPECPAEAIFLESEVPTKWKAYVDLNARRSLEIKAQSGPLSERKDPLLGPSCVMR